MEEKNSTPDSLVNTTVKKRRTLFLRPAKKIAVDIAICFSFNSVFIYLVMILIPDTAIAMTSGIWVGIVAWRGGIVTGLIACIVIFFSNTIFTNLPPHDHLQSIYLFDQRIPSFAVGLLQTLIVGVVVGYISTLVHSLRNEIDLREKTQNALEQKVAELNAFGRTVAHDLKNPLTVINVSIYALLKEFSKSDNENAKKKLAFINDGTKHMINIIESILILAGIKKIDSRQYKSFHISQCIEEALERMEYNIEANHVEILKPNNWPSVIGYAPWITEVWVNYINNAIKYGGNPSTHSRKTIELGFDLPGQYQPPCNDQYRFWVRDNGEGIAKEKQAVLFKEFARLHSTEHEGHGLGLSIVKKIVDKFDGVVGVESEVGLGSCFYFTLPIPPDRNHPPANEATSVNTVSGKPA